MRLGIGDGVWHGRGTSSGGGMGVVRAKDLPLKVLMPRPPPFAIPPLHHADFGINPRSLAPIWSWRDLSASSVSVMARRKI